MDGPGSGVTFTAGDGDGGGARWQLADIRPYLVLAFTVWTSVANSLCSEVDGAIETHA